MDRHSVHCDPIGTGEFLFVKKKILKMVAHAQTSIEGKKIVLRASLYLSLYSFLDRNVLV